MRSINGTGLIVAGLVATLAALLFPVWSYEDRSGTGQERLDAETVSTEFGPLSALDRDFITKVRLAGLWELPAGQQAEARGTSKAVQTAGEHLVEGHTFLDARVREVATQLRLELPNQPTSQQRGWLDEMSDAHGDAYDEKFANILRAAHGKVFSVVAEVRATTRNSLVRTLADDANTTVLDHITVLEDTGLVDFDDLARDAASAAPVPVTRSPGPPGPTASPAPATPVSPSPTFTLPPPASRPKPQEDEEEKGEKGKGEKRGKGGKGAPKGSTTSVTKVRRSPAAKGNVTYPRPRVRMVNNPWRSPRSLAYNTGMFWLPLLLVAWVVTGLSCARLCLTAYRTARHDGAPGCRYELTLYEAAFLSGGPGRVTDLALVSMARARRLLLAHTGWATVVDPVGGDEMERSVLGAIGPGGQSPIAPVRRAAAGSDPMRALADRLVAAGLALPDGTWSGVAGAVRQVRAAAVAVVALGAVALLMPVQEPSDQVVPVALWFALPLVVNASCLAVARFEIHPYPRWASPAGQLLLSALPAREGSDLTAVAVRGTRALADPELRAAFAHRDTTLRNTAHRGH